jgi:hypothetical protein
MTSAALRIGGALHINQLRASLLLVLVLVTLVASSRHEHPRCMTSGAPGDDRCDDGHPDAGWPGSFELAAAVGNRMTTSFPERIGGR